MDLIELALNPAKANRRFSPFVNEMPKGFVNKLEYSLDYATGDPVERAVYSKDAATPPAIFKLLLKRDAWAVARPTIKGDLLELIRFANQNHIPIIPRGGGTSGFGGAVPTEGGVVVDMREFNKILSVHKAAKTVTVEPGITFMNLELALNQQGLALRQYPTSAYGATVGGWVCTGGGGVGSAKYGPFRSDILEAEMIDCSGKPMTLKGADLDLVYATHGISGFLTQVTLQVREKTDLLPYLLVFDNMEVAMQSARRVTNEVGAWHIALHTPEYADQVNEAAGAKLLPGGKYSLLVVLESFDNVAIEKIKGISLTAAGSLAKDDQARKVWDARFDHMNVKRLGPSIVVSEAVIHVDRLGEAITRVRDSVKSDIHCLWAIAIGKNEFDLVFYGLEDERRPTYPTGLGNSVAMLDAVKKAGGRSYGTGVLLAHERKKLFAPDVLKRLRAHKKKTDPRSVFNPGPVLGARTRPMPLPVRDFPLMMRVSSPQIKWARGQFPYPGGARADPSHVALHKALGRVNSGSLADVDYDVTTCIRCAACNHVAPERPYVHWETALPRGRVLAASALLQGDVTPTPHLHEEASKTPLSRNADAICPTRIPIQRVTDLLLAACVDAFGPLPAHAALAANVAKEGNVLGKPAANRTKWATLNWDNTSRLLFFGDDVGSYEAPEVLNAAARVLANANVQMTYLGKDEKTSAAPLLETGQRAAAAEAISEMQDAFVKRRIDAVVSPDANAVRAFKLDWPLLARANNIESWDVAAMHTTESIAAQLKAKRLEIANKWTEKAVYHAPEALDEPARQAGLDILKALGADIVPCSHADCGHGRGLDTHKPELANRIAEDALRAIIATGAKVLVTSSPGCYTTFKKIAKKVKAEIQVVDLHELVAQNMKVAEGGAAVAAPVAAAEPEVAAEPVIGPDQFRVEYVKEKRVLAVGKNQTILDAALEAGMELPYSCRAGSCDTCSAKWEGTAPDQSAGAALSAEQQKKFVLTCIARPKGPLKIWSEEKP
ncbi:MAG TPA: FAD-binding protein [Candidatus Thermoplasmatota archaeon]|nr:FAD-binding protein [Candidatus Thermoplasmatota archaeon]